MLLDDRLKNETLFNLAFLYAPIGMGLIAPDGTVLKANSSASSIIGYSEQELRLIGFQKITHPDDREQDNEYVHQLLAGKSSSFQWEKRYIHKQGHTVWVLLSVTLIREENGMPLFFITQFTDISKQKTAEDALHRKHDLFNLISDNAQDLITYASPDGITRYISSSVQQILGYDPEELLDKPAYELWHPDDLAILAQSELLKHSDEDIFSCRVRHKDGHYIWFETKVKTIRNAKGEVEKVIGVGRNITERRLVEDELKKTKERLESFIHNNADAIWVVDEDDRLIEVNAAFETMFGWKAKEIVGRRLPIIPQELEQSIGCIHERVKKGESVIGLETIRQRKDGSRLEVSTTISPLRSANGSAIGLTAICRDISEKKQADKELKEAKDLLESFVDNNLDPIMIFNATDRVIRVNKAYERTFGWKAAEVIGLPASRLQQIPTDHKSDIDKIADVIRAGQSVEAYETIRMKKDGTLLNVMLNSFPILDQQGRFDGWSLILKDITEQKQTEKLMINSEKLTLAGQFAAGIAHEIRNPLTAIKGFVKLLKSGYGEKQQYFDIMTSEIERIEVILSELLILAKPQAAKFERKDIRALLAQVTTLLDTQAILNNIQIVTEFSPGITHIYCDENQLKQVCINFIKNAIEAMPDGGTITIQLGRKDNDRVRLRFIDQGHGIPESILKKLGQPFYSTKEKGTGLGFMVSKRIIETHGGDIQVFSEESKGTTIELILPVHAQQSLS